MSEPLIAEITIFAGNFAPRSWAFCNGQLLPISQNTALFSIIGTTYGGDGRTTTGLPNLQGRAPMHPGRGPGLTSRRLGENGGVETETLSESQIPNHTHGLEASSFPANDDDAAGKYLARGTGVGSYASSGVGAVAAGDAVGNSGGSQAHENMQPFLTMSFIIALQGLYPSRS
jgi:microcystin-dependent protein